MAINVTLPLRLPVALALLLITVRAMLARY